jgi:tetratricopeptide (TPR) repeat protein
LFHKGMSLFNLKRYQEALNILEPISQNTSSSFIQIAEYHSALCFEELGKKDNALATYRKIVQRAGLYKDKAAKRIKAIE